MNKLRVNQFYQKLFKSLKAKASDQEINLSHYIKEYQQDQSNYSKRDFSPSKKNDLFKSIDKSNIIYLGDFHTFDQSSKNLERIMRFLIESKNDKLVLGMELINHKYQIAVDSFIEHQLTELEFLDSIKYSESWKFPWNHYKIIFDIAKKNKLKILALNSEGSLKERDLVAAKIINRHYRENPESKILILFGELHIIPNKLPLMVEEEVCDPALKQTIIHQNLDNVYWKMEDQKQHHRIIKFNSSEFSLQSAPPWLKYESMLYWYEHLVEDPDFDIHNYIIETGKKVFNHEVQDNFFDLVKLILSSLNIKQDEKNFEDFVLHFYKDLNKVLDRLEKLNHKNLIQFYHKLLLENEVFAFPSSYHYYCSNYSITRLTYLAGIHVFQTITHKQKCKNLQNDRLSRFGEFVKEAIMGYLASKVINPYRKCDMYIDFQEALSDKSLSKTKKIIAQQTLNIIDSPDNTYQVMLPNNFYMNYCITRKLGHFIGEIIYTLLKAETIKDFNLYIQAILNTSNKKDSIVQLLKNVLNETNYKESKKRFF